MLRSRALILAIIGGKTCGRETGICRASQPHSKGTPYRSTLEVELKAIRSMTVLSNCAGSSKVERRRKLAEAGRGGDPQDSDNFPDNHQPSSASCYCNKHGRC
ncbi:hypothetical protein PSPO01_04346 [Paraphaeosphaeria sporulosa]